MLKQVTRKLGVIASSVAVAATGLVAAATPAQAAACVYPYACLYATGVYDPVERYQVITSGFQTYTRTDIRYGRNTRRDDVVHIRFTNGNIVCFPAGTPNTYRRIGSGSNGIRIVDASTCGSYPVATTYP